MRAMKANDNFHGLYSFNWEEKQLFFMRTLTIIRK
jgi:hypothetical protein